MIEFDQYLGFLAFLTILTIGFLANDFPCNICNTILVDWKFVAMDKRI